MSDESTGCADDGSDLSATLATIVVNETKLDRILLSARIERRVNERMLDVLHKSWMRTMRDDILRIVNEELDR
jgi:hypothetical protein